MRRSRLARTTADRDTLQAVLAADAARAALTLARRFSAGATLWCVAPRWPAHARHVAVEFVHPVIVGKRALPAVALVDGEPALTLRAAGRAGDVVLAIGAPGEPVVADVLADATARGLTAVVVDEPDEGAAYDGRVALAYHVLWELTHLCLEHPGLVADEATGGTGAGEAGFLYPFLDGREHDVGALLDDMTASAAAKRDESGHLAAATRQQLAGEIERAAAAIAERLAAGGRVLTFGNGGSATDAQGLAALLTRPPAGRALPALALTDDPAVLTALANDVGYERVFARQLMAHGRAGDVAVGLSTSGRSASLLAGFAEARRRGLLTVGLAGYDGGDLAVSADVDHRLVVGSTSVHRIQEAQSALTFALWSAVQDHLGGGRG